MGTEWAVSGIDHSAVVLSIIMCLSTLMSGGFDPWKQYFSRVVISFTWNKELWATNFSNYLHPEAMGLAFYFLAWENQISAEL